MRQWRAAVLQSYQMALRTVVTTSFFILPVKCWATPWTLGLFLFYQLNAGPRQLWAISSEWMLGHATEAGPLRPGRAKDAGPLDQMVNAVSSSNK
jgi:hypothetical protein